jgi:hypothetical protein
MRDWYVVHGEGHSTVYYGFYRTVRDEEDKQEAARAKGDRKAIAGLVNAATGARMFGGVFLVELDAADTTGPAEWNLVNAKGYYSLEIGVYKDNPQRKEAAVEAVRAARANGYEAYYYHGPAVSSVCIGAWPESAVRKQGDGKVRDPNAVGVLVPESVNLPPGLTTADGRPIEVVQAKAEIVDGTLLAMMKAFPTHAVNGVEGREVRDAKTGTVRVVREPSILVVMPRERPETATAARGAARFAAPAAPGAEAAPAAPAPPVDPSRSGRPGGPAKGGKLKSIED